MMIAQRLLIARRLLHTTVIPTRNKSNVHPGYKKIKEIQKEWMYGDGIPVHVKGGNFDRMLFTSTLVFTGLGLILVGNSAYNLIFPAKKE